MTDTFEPADEAQACEIVKDARAARRSFEIRGGGTRAGFGRPVDAGAILSTARLTGITLYEPAELVVAARAGTPLREVEAALAARGQSLPFEPADYRGLYGAQGEPTIGAVAACNISGPRRVQTGAARDHLIGVRLVNGYGEIVKSGGRVMKNVTGLDLVKLSCGGHGTLGVLTEVTFKLLPAAAAETTLALDGLADADAIVALQSALASPFEVSGAAHLPAGIQGPDALTLLRLERSPESLAYRADRLAADLSAHGSVRRIEGAQSKALWRGIADVAPFAKAQAPIVWRLSIPAGLAARAVADISGALGARHLYDWGGGLVWLALLPRDDAGAAIVRHATAAAGGHATLMRAPDEIRRRIDVFPPLGAPLLKITAGLKTSFDPDGLFNPGRMYADM